MNINLNHSNLYHLTSQCSIGSVISVFDNIKNRTVFNLINKNSAFERTSYPFLAACLSTLKHQIKEKNIKKLAVQQSDYSAGLHWPHVCKIIFAKIGFLTN